MRKYIELSSYLGFFALCIVIVFREFWVADNTYVMLRVAQNFMHGFGLRFNIDERVQVFNSLLTQAAIIAPLYFLNHYPLVAAHSITFLFFVVAITLSYRLFNKSNLQSVAFFVALLMLSRIFREYANGSPTLAISCAALTLFALFTKKESHFNGLFFASSLCILGEYKLVIICLPILLYQLCKNFSYRQLKKAFWASSLLWGWLLFCLIFYGFALPNNYNLLFNPFVNNEALFESKKFSEISLLVAIKYDAYTLLVIGCAFFWNLLNYSKNTTVYHLQQFLLTLGMVLYTLFVLFCAPTYGVGEVFALPFYLSCLVLANNAGEYAKKNILILALNAYLASLIWMYQGGKELTRAARLYSVVVPSRSEFIKRFDTLSPTTYFPDRTWERASQDIDRDINRALVNVHVFKNITKECYALGPHSIIIDESGNADALLSRIPSLKPANDKQSTRVMPTGYELARASFRPDDPITPLQHYYEKLWIIKSMPVFDINRLITLWGMHLGWYDEYLEKYIHHNAKNDVTNIDEVRVEKIRKSLLENSYESITKPPTRENEYLPAPEPEGDGPIHHGF